jgi:hypothetical protein
VTYISSLVLVAHYDEQNKIRSMYTALKGKSPERARKGKAGIKMVGC